MRNMTGFFGFPGAAALIGGVVAMTLAGCGDARDAQRPATGPPPAVSASGEAPAPADDSRRAARDAQRPATVTMDRDIPIGPGDLPAVRLQPVFTNLELSRPVGLVPAADGSDRLFVLEQRGRILAFENRDDVEEAGTFLDIRERIFMGHNEEGLLSLAFDPQFTDNGWFYVWYSASSPRRMVLSRFSVTSEDPTRADPDSELVILQVEQPWGNHNGGTILFGDDGMLYLSIGDGGAANDPHNHSQNLETLLGTIVRIDVRNAEEDEPYAIPDDNPFVDREGARGEIWAYGLRNIWRMAFDDETGDLWGADVGQNAWEAVYVIRRGENYGWNIREGAQPFRRPRADEPADPIVDPVIEYSHRQGQSITGGNVYRGRQNEALVGAYLFADYVTGRIWACRLDESGRVNMAREVLRGDRRPHVTSFGEDIHGEVYICAFERMDRGPGRIYRIVEN